MALLERFFPDIYVKSVFELPLEDLKKLGIRGRIHKRKHRVRY